MLPSNRLLSFYWNVFLSCVQPQILHIKRVDLAGKKCKDTDGHHKYYLTHMNLKQLLLII